MISSTLFRSVLLFGAALLAASLGQAQDLGAVRNQMEARLPAINELKQRQAVGETNRGFLEVRGTVSGAEQQVVSDENSDRRKVYAALAKQTGASPDEVGRQRALKIASLAKRGHWVQEPNGDWRQK